MNGKRLAASCAVAILCVLAHTAGLAFQSPDFGGAWRRNEQVSDDGPGEIERVMGRPLPEGAGGRAYTLFGRDALLDNMDRVALHRALGDYVSRLYRMEIEHSDRTLEVTLAGDYLGIFYLDGESHARQLGNGARLEAVCKVDGHSIRVRQKGEDATLVEIYTLQPNGQLTVDLKLQSALLDEPIAFLTVYDRVEDEARP